MSPSPCINKVLFILCLPDGHLRFDEDIYCVPEPYIDEAVFSSRYLILRHVIPISLGDSVNFDYSVIVLSDIFTV